MLTHFKVSFILHFVLCLQFKLNVSDNTFTRSDYSQSNELLNGHLSLERVFQYHIFLEDGYTIKDGKPIEDKLGLLSLFLNKAGLVK